MTLSMAGLIARRDRRELEALLDTVWNGTLEWRHEDGVVRRFGRGEPHAAVRWSDRATKRTLTEGVIGFCDGWVCGDWSIDEGTLLDVMTALVSARLNQALKRRAHLWIKARVALGYARAQLTRAHMHDSVRSHYDVGTDFYRLWLDDDLVYTCGVARRADDDLDAMQKQKLALVCSKLRLERGMRLLDLGCGWGALSIWAAKRHGVSVTAVNVSRSQCAFLRERVERERVSHLVRVVEGDFREVRGEFDRVAAIGIAEHLGRARLDHLFRAIGRAIDERGLALVHTIGSSTTGGTDPWLERAVFPGSYVPTLSELVRAAESHSQRVLHVDNFGMHYALTLRHWHARFLAARDAIRAGWGERLYRTFEMYLALLVPTFEHLSTGLYQVLLSGGEGVPEIGDISPRCGVEHACVPAGVR